jgi:hypothetical protein
MTIDDASVGATAVDGGRRYLARSGGDFEELAVVRPRSYTRDFASTAPRLIGRRGGNRISIRVPPSGRKRRSRKRTCSRARLSASRDEHPSLAEMTRSLMRPTARRSRGLAQFRLSRSLGILESSFDPVADVAGEVVI